MCGVKRSSSVAVAVAMAFVVMVLAVVLDVVLFVVVVAVAVAVVVVVVVVVIVAALVIMHEHITGGLRGSVPLKLGALADDTAIFDPMALNDGVFPKRLTSPPPSGVSFRIAV